MRWIRLIGQLLLCTHVKPHVKEAELTKRSLFGFSLLPSLLQHHDDTTCFWQVPYTTPFKLCSLTDDFVFLPFYPLGLGSLGKQCSFSRMITNEASFFFFGCPDYILRSVLFLNKFWPLFYNILLEGCWHHKEKGSIFKLEKKKEEYSGILRNRLLPCWLIGKNRNIEVYTSSTLYYLSMVN